METVNSIKAAIAAVCAALSALWGWFGWVVAIWILFMIIDYLTGTAAAFKEGRWSSKAARDGIWHKLGCIAAVLVAGLLDIVLGHLLGSAPIHPVNYTVFLCPMVVIWYILTEAGSIVENAGVLGAPIPKWLRKAIEQLKDKMDNEDKDNEENEEDE